MPEETTETTTETTSGATEQNTTGSTTGAVTETAQQTQVDVTQTPEFKAAVTAAIEKKIPQLKRQLANQLTGEKEGQPNVEDLQRQLSDKDARIRSFEARETVDAFLNDGRNKLSIRPENVRGIQELVIPRLEYDEDGKPSNLKEAIESAKVIAPALFTSGTSNINAFSGNGQQARPGNMNDLIRQSAGIG